MRAIKGLKNNQRSAVSKHRRIKKATKGMLLLLLLPLLFPPVWI